MYQRKIIHVDCDCFYVAVERLKDPTLIGRPVAVGGPSRGRGVIASCSYEARAFGVRSAMPTGQAMRLCPDLVLVRGDMASYQAVSAQIRHIFDQYTDVVEPLSIDEAFLDVTDSPHCRGSATLMAQALRQRIRAEVGITVSAGVAPNRFLAKIASDWRKPDGLFVVRPEEAAGFAANLPAARLHGVGPATLVRLNKLGVRRCGDILQLDDLQLIREFGKYGLRLRELAQGVDPSPIRPHRNRKSLSVEHTFTSDLPDVASCQSQLPALVDTLQERLARARATDAVSQQFVKLKFTDFQQTTLEVSCDYGIEIGRYAELCREAWERGGKPVRLLGVGVRFRSHQAPAQQLPIWA
ncbi:MAG TPA: DNA polymerase IV [Spongiibacteraceae bacterium]|jgi:DNA polymerase-4|nr:DNA polymerase IV [Spongiibacteraceae bacterium]HUH37190.1 DNA polymerase IV [Spongiibacteraceae bacterium]